MKIKLLSASLLLACSANLALAETIPYVMKGSPDSRIRHVKYVNNDIVVIHGVAGIATDIVLNEDEVVRAWYAGDKSAWQLVHIDNNVFIKPKTNKNPMTNIHLVTNKRNYILKMVLARRPFYKVIFHYPNDKYNKTKRSVIEKRLSNALNPFKQTNKNLRYYAQGSKKLIPREMFDNGTTTFVRFGRDQELPIIYKTNVFGFDQIANFTVSGEWLILPTVHKKWTLRLGYHTTTVLNDDYKPSKATSTGTASSEVTRILK